MSSKVKKIPVGENILIDLMPESYKAVVNLRKLIKQWIYAVIIIAVIAVLTSVSFYAKSVMSSMTLQSEKALQATIDQQISAYAEVNQALESQKEANKLLSQGASTEIDWQKLISTIQSVLPSGTNISSLNTSVGGSKENDAAAGVVLDLSSSSPIQYADSLKSIESIKGVKSVTIGPMSLNGDAGYSYQVAFTYDNTIRTNRFVQSKEKN